MDRISSSSKNYGKSLTSPNSQSQIKISKNSMYKMKSPNYKTPLKAQQVTNFNNANNSPTNINMNTFYQKFTPTSITKQQQFLNKNDKKRKSSFSSHYENDGGSNKKMKNDQCITPRFAYIICSNEIIKILSFIIIIELISFIYLIYYICFLLLILYILLILIIKEMRI